MATDFVSKEEQRPAQAVAAKPGAAGAARRPFGNVGNAQVTRPAGKPAPLKALAPTNAALPAAAVVQPAPVRASAEVLVAVPAAKLAPAPAPVELLDEDGACNMSLEESLSVSLLLDEAPATQPGALDEAETGSVEDIDEADDEDPQCVTEYVNDIYQVRGRASARGETRGADAGAVSARQRGAAPS